MVRYPTTYSRTLSHLDGRDGADDSAVTKEGFRPSPATHGRAVDELNLGREAQRRRGRQEGYCSSLSCRCGSRGVGVRGLARLKCRLNWVTRVLGSRRTATGSSRLDSRPFAANSRRSRCWCRRNLPPSTVPGRAKGCKSRLSLTPSPRDQQAARRGSEVKCASIFSRV